MSELVEVVANWQTKGERVLRWSRVLARKSLDELTHYAEVDLEQGERQYIAEHMRVWVLYSVDLGGGLRITRRPVVSIYIDKISNQATSKGLPLSFNGRSAARDIVDSTWSDSIGEGRCSASSTRWPRGSASARWQGRRLLLLRPGRDQTPANDPTGLVPEFAFENESPWAKLQQEAANQGAIITSSQTGGLYVGRVSTTENRWGFRLKEGWNISAIGESVTGDQQFHTYIIRGGDGLEETGTDSTAPTSGS